ncbi:AAA family ATPase [Nocardia sp. NPDC051030]|uniref:AAA family ATPase n=1 Tax=Nocardia sp. NPDC051030 TaxID=3155162 RepID=UPI003443F661
MRDIYWIGGGSGAGKSTIAARIAKEHGLRTYSTDDVMSEHARRCTPEDAPYLHEFLAMSMDERWVRRSPETMLETFHWFRGEGFGLIVEDLLRMGTDGGVIVEGFRLLPHLVAPLVSDSRGAVWLLPTPEFRQAAFDLRGWDIPSRTGDPEAARRNLLERDRMFTDRLETDTRRLGLPVIEVDTPMDEDELLERVCHSLKL